MSPFWRTWLNIWCWAVILFGLVLTGAAFEGTDAIAQALFALVDGPGEPVWDSHLRFSVALMGAVTLGWGLTLRPALQAADLLGPERGAPVWRAIVAATVIWYVVDSVLSVATGFALNAVSNTLFLIAFLAPVLASGVLRSGAIPTARPARA